MLNQVSMPTATLPNILPWVWHDIIMANMRYSQITCSWRAHDMLVSLPIGECISLRVGLRCATWCSFRRGQGKRHHTCLIYFGANQSTHQTFRAYQPGSHKGPPSRDKQVNEEIQQGEVTKTLFPKLNPNPTSTIACFIQHVYEIRKPCERYCTQEEGRSLGERTRSYGKPCTTRPDNSFRD